MPCGRFCCKWRAAGLRSRAREDKKERRGGVASGSQSGLLGHPETKVIKRKVATSPEAQPAAASCGCFHP